jgi:hypothetical protein
MRWVQQRRRVMATLGLIRLAPVTMFAILAVGPQRAGQPDVNDAGVQAFLRSVGEYLSLREQLYAPLPPLEVSSDANKIRNAVEARAAALRRARARVRPGDVFNRPVSNLFRSLIRQVLAATKYDVAWLLDEMTDDGDQWRPAAVNGRFSWATACATPPPVLAVLPTLPDELQYRFVGPDLALVDVDASYIIDVLPEALDLQGVKRRKSGPKD